MVYPVGELLPEMFYPDGWVQVIGNQYVVWLPMPPRYTLLRKV